jgi:hypothetical protein
LAVPRFNFVQIGLQQKGAKLASPVDNSYIQRAARQLSLE